MNLIKEVFSTKDANALTSLWEEDSSSKMRLRIAREIGKRLSE